MSGILAFGGAWLAVSFLFGLFAGAFMTVGGRDIDSPGMV